MLIRIRTPYHSDIWSDWRQHQHIRRNSSDLPNIKVTSVEKYSLDPADYHEHLSITSEMMRYIASSARLSFAFVGDLGWAINNFRITKLLISISDRDPIDPAIIRINANDFEEWDYLNSKFEAETIGDRVQRTTIGH